MKAPEYAISFGPPGKGYERLKPLWIYNQQVFINLKEGYEQISCFHLDHSKKKIINSIDFLCLQGKAVSLPASPFGGFSFGNTQKNLFRQFIKVIITHLANKNMTEVIIKSPASFYLSTSEQDNMDSLSDYGFLIEDEAINHHLPITDKGFNQIIHKMQVRKLRKADVSNLTFTVCQPEDFPVIYDFIADCRRKKNVEINISKAQLLASLRALPANYMAFKVCKAGEIIAATIVVKVSEQIIYNYLPASNPTFNKLSPMVYLLAGLYSYCQTKKLAVIDLGISTLNKLPQETLINFKEKVGGIGSSKLTYKLKLS